MSTWEILNDHLGIQQILLPLGAITVFTKDRLANLGNSGLKSEGIPVDGIGNLSC
jgi:hypothetical protein